MSAYYDENELDDNVPLSGSLLHKLGGVIKPHWRTLLGGVLGIALWQLPTFSPPA